VPLRCAANFFLQVHEEIVCMIQQFALLMTSIIHIDSYFVHVKTRENCMYIIIDQRKL
jgi:hypothetical protein